MIKRILQSWLDTVAVLVVIVGMLYVADFVARRLGWL